MILCYKIIQNNCQWASNPLSKVVLSNFNSTAQIFQPQFITAHSRYHGWSVLSFLCNKMK